jgi:hypothetical protein
LTTTFQVAVDASTARVNSMNWRAPSMVRKGSSIAARQPAGTGFRSGGARLPNAFRTACGAVGARSPPQAVVTLALLNERSSRKKSSRFRPQRTLR